MPRYISKDGVWFPAKEKVGLDNKSGKEIEVNGVKVGAGEPFIYEGPDRAAVVELHKTGEETMGQHFENDPDLVDRVRQRGMKDMKEYKKRVGYDPDKAEKEFQEKASVVHKHELPKRAKAIEIMGGGRGGGKYSKGGFGDQPE